MYTHFALRNAIPACATSVAFLTFVSDFIYAVFKLSVVATPLCGFRLPTLVYDKLKTNTKWLENKCGSAG